MTGRGKKQASRRKGPPLPAAAPLPHSDDTEEPPSRSGSPVKAKKPPTRSGSPVTAKKPRKDCRITDPGVEDELVEWFRKNDSLWNTQRTAYRDIDNPCPRLSSKTNFQVLVIVINC